MQVHAGFGPQKQVCFGVENCIHNGIITLTNYDVKEANNYVVKEKGGDTKEESEVLFQMLMVDLQLPYLINTFL